MDKFFRKLTKYTAIFASYATVASIVSSFKDRKMNEENRKIMEQIKNNVEQIRKFTDIHKDNINDETLNKITRLSYDFDSKINNTINKINNIQEINNKLVEVKNDSKVNNDLVSQLNNEINNNIDFTRKGLSESKGILDKIMDILNNISNSSNSSNFINYINYYLNEYLKFLESLDLILQISLAHLLCSIVILWCLISIILIYYGEYLINKLKLENKFPKLAKYIQLRRKFQQYYFFINICLIIITLSLLIYFDLFILINY